MPVVIVSLVTYIFGLLISRCEKVQDKKIVFFCSLIPPVLSLVYFKYSYLLSTSMTGVNSPALENIAIPLAISFFTFEFIHYLCEIYNGAQPIKNLWHFSLFVIFFPSLVAGPIKRFQNFIPQVQNGIRKPSSETFLLGVLQTVIGFSKKLLIADNVTIMARILESKPDLNSLDVIILVFLLYIRILFDFSGYSDIAIGLAKMIGIIIPQNFNYPYIATNISEFWRRWHISLSTWIRDYLYIPLGGNKYGILRKIFILIFVMFICGMWHGASWHYGIWGIYHGIGLGVHSLWKELKLRNQLISSRVYSLACLCITNIFVMYGWLIFFYPIERVWELSKIIL